MEEWRAKVPAAPSLELFRCSAPEEHRDMWNRILGPSKTFVGKPGVMKRFFPSTEPELFKSGGVPGPRWPPPRYAVPEFPETGVEPPVLAGWPTAAQHEVHPHQRHGR